VEEKRGSVWKETGDDDRVGEGKRGKAKRRNRREGKVNKDQEEGKWKKGDRSGVHRPGRKRKQMHWTRKKSTGPGKGEKGLQRMEGGKGRCVQEQIFSDVQLDHGLRD